MNSSIVYHSHSGKTKNVVEQVHKAMSADITEVTPRHPYSALSLVPIGCYRALRGTADPVFPDTIDVSQSDLVVIASPVWAGRPSPVINGAVTALTGCQGKKAYIIITCGDAQSGEQAVTPLRKRIEERGMTYAGSMVLDKNHVDDAASITDMIGDIRSAGGV